MLTNVRHKERKKRKKHACNRQLPFHAFLSYPSIHTTLYLNLRFFTFACHVSSFAFLLFFLFFPSCLHIFILFYCNLLLKIPFILSIPALLLLIFPISPSFPPCSTAAISAHLCQYSTSLVNGNLSNPSLPSRP